MRSVKSLILGMVLAIACALLPFLLTQVHPKASACIPLAVLAVLILLVNPLCRRLSFCKPFTQMELAIIASMTLVASSIASSFLPLRMLGAMTALYNSQLTTADNDWNAAIAHLLPDHLFLADMGTQKAAQDYWEAQETERQTLAALKTLKQQQAQEELLLHQYLDCYHQHEARAYRCKPQELAIPRREKDQLTRELIQLTRTINAIKANPENNLPKTLEQAVELNRKIAGLYQKRNRIRQKISGLDQTLARLTAHPLPEAVPRLNAIRQDLQQQQDVLRGLRQTIQEHLYQCQLQHDSVLGTQQAYRETIAASMKHTERLQAPCQPLPLRSWQDVKSLLRGVPWALWLPPLLSWGVILMLVLLIVHCLSILLVRQWSVLDEDKPDFPLARILQDSFPPQDDRHPGLDLFTRPSFCVCFFLGVLLLSLCDRYLPEPTVAWHQLLPWESLRPAARSLPLSFSLPLFALALILPRPLSASLWGTQVLLALVLALALPALSLASWSPVLDEGSLRSGLLSFGLGSGVMLGSLLLWRSKSLLFCALHPYDIPHAKRAERHALTRASGLLLFCVIALFLSLNILLEQDVLSTLGMLGLLFVSVAVLMRLSSELGFGTTPWGCASYSVLPLSSASPSLALFTHFLIAPASNSLCASLPHAVRLGNLSRTRAFLHQLAILGTMVLVIGLSVCTGLALAYGGRLPLPITIGMAETHRLFQWLLTPPLELTPRPWFLLAGLLYLLVLSLLRRVLPWLPNPLALVLLPFALMEQAWLPMLGGWLVLYLTSRHASERTQAMIRQGAIGVLCASLLLAFLSF